MKILTTLVLLCGTMFAQCPVEFQKIDPRDTTPKLSDPFVFHFKLKWKNISEKTITGTKWKVTFIDATNDRHELLEDWTLQGRDKPGQSRTSSWEDGYYIRAFGHPKAEIRLVKAAFSDGTVWEDDGAGKCKGNSK